MIEGKYFNHKECNGNAQNSSDDVADNGGEAQPIEENQDDYVLDKVVRYVGNSEAHILPYTHCRRENQLAVQPVGDNIADDIANIEIQIIPWTDKFQNPGKKYSVKGIYTAHHKEHDKSPVEKVMTYF